MNHHTYTRQHYFISTDPTLLDLDVIHGYLRHSYWSPGVPREVVEKSIVNSLNFGLYHDEQEQEQIGFARVITDYHTYAYLCDVFILHEHRGNGLGIWLIECVTSCAELQGIRSFALGTRDAHDLYRKFGFEVPENAERIMLAGYNMPWRDESLITDPPTREKL